MSAMKSVACAALVLAMALPAAAGSMRSEGENELNVGLKLDYGEHFFNREAQRVGAGCAGSLSLPVSYERGLSYYRTFFAKGGVKTERCAGTTRLEDVELGLRGRVDPLSDALVWEASVLLPASRWSGGRLDRDSGSLGVNAGLHVDNLPDPYASFLDPETHRQIRFGYGAGLRAWTAHVPAQAWAYLAWSRRFGEANWQRNIGSWWLYARLDAKHSIGREHRTRADDGLDPHARYWNLSASVYFSRQIKPWQVLTIGLRHDLAGRNVADGSGLSVHYSWNWRD